MTSSYTPAKREKTDAGGDKQHHQPKYSCKEENESTDEQQGEQYQFLIGDDVEFSCKDSTDEEGEEKRKSAT